MNDGIEQYPAEKKRIKGDDLPKPDLPVSGAPSGSDIEPFPAVKQRMKPDDPPFALSERCQAGMFRVESPRSSAVYPVVYGTGRGR